jgi:hypothetical protein
MEEKDYTVTQVGEQVAQATRERKGVQKGERKLGEAGVVPQHLLLCDLGPVLPLSGP